MKTYFGKLEDIHFLGDEDKYMNVIRSGEGFRLMIRARLDRRKNGKRMISTNQNTSTMFAERNGRIAEGSVEDFVKYDPEWADVIEEALGVILFGRCRYCGRALLNKEKCCCSEHKERGSREDSNKILHAETDAAINLAETIVRLWMKDYEHALKALKKSQEGKERKEAQAHVLTIENQIRSKRFSDLTMGNADPEEVI